MPAVVDDLRAACALVARRATHVQVVHEAIPEYAESLPLGVAAPPSGRCTHVRTGTREELAAFWLTLDAINFGSGWFPTLRKREGGSGYHTIATGIRVRFADLGPWPATELAVIDARELAGTLLQEPGHELMGLFARSLNDLGSHVANEYGGRFDAVLQAARGSAVALVELLGGWDCFADTSIYRGVQVPFLKRAQIAAADLARAQLFAPDDIHRLTMFADNLVPHALRLDGVLAFEPELVRRIEAAELIEHGSPEEVEIRACAVHAVELIARSLPGAHPVDIDQLLWLRGQEPRYKAFPRHRSRCTAY
jgi:Potential Queuosine, Q, salvage protein family